MRTNIHFFIVSRSVLLRMKNVSDKSCRENQNTHFMFNNHSLLLKNRAIYEIMWKNTVQPGRPHITIWRMPIECRITKATNTHTICSTYCFSTAQMVARIRLNVTLYIYCLYCIIRIWLQCIMFRLNKKPSSEY